MRLVLVSLALLNCFLFFSYSAVADEVAPKEMVCLTTHYPPYTIYRKKTRDFVGLDMKYINRLAKKLDWDLTVLNFPWGRVKLEVEKDLYNCFFSMSYSKQRAEHLSYTSHPLHVTQYGVFYNKKHTQIEQKNLTDKVVAVLRGIPLHEGVLDKYGLGQAEVVYLDSNKTLLDILTTGRVDASVLNYNVGNFLLESSPHKSDIDSFVVPEFELPVYLAFRKGTQDIEEIDALLKHMMTEDEAAKNGAELNPELRLNTVLPAALN